MRPFLPVALLAGGVAAGCEKNTFVPVPLKPIPIIAAKECSARIVPFPEIKQRDYSKLPKEERFKQFSVDRVVDWRRAKTAFWENASNQRLCQTWVAQLALTQKK